MKIAYFCAEFALESDMPSYAGGLGVLAGDYVLQAADSDFPLTGISLYYEKGQNGNIINFSHKKFGLKIVRQSLFKKLIIEIPIANRHIKAQVWQWQKKGVSVYFLDTNIPENLPEDRQITSELYAENRDIRLMQEIILGIGGAILLERLKIQPDLYHLNEGHSAFLSLYLLGQEIKRGLNWQNAIDSIKQKIVFTNHTLVLEGQELFAQDALLRFLGPLCENFRINFLDFYKLGTDEESDTLFSMTVFALNCAGLSNAVSKIHGEKARELWKNWPLIHITNGIYLPRWDKINKNDIQSAHAKNEDILLALIKEIRGKDWKKDALLVGWSRRFVPYKRPLALLEDIQKLKQIAELMKGKIHIVYSAPLGEDARNHNEFLGKLYGLMDGELSDLVTFLPNYRLDLAEKLVAGCDVWLNTPIVGREACGTSGMKAALNGCLPISTNDGWINEVDITDKGWLIDDENITDSILNTLINKVIPAYNDSDTWKSMMIRCRELIKNDFSTERMLSEYIEKLYRPIINTQSHEQSTK